MWRIPCSKFGLLSHTTLHPLNKPSSDYDVPGDAHVWSDLLLCPVVWSLYALVTLPPRVLL